MLDKIDERYFLMAIGNAPKKQMNNSDWSVRCPICGDSHIHRQEKRLHLYEKNGETRVHCFNEGCPVGSTNVRWFLKKFYPDLYSAYSKEKFHETMTDLKTDVFGQYKEDTLDKLSNQKFDFGDLNYLIDESESDNSDNDNNRSESPNEQTEVLVQNFDKYFIELTDAAKNYIKRRGFDYMECESAFGQWYCGDKPLQIGDKTYYLRNSLIIPLYCYKDMFGFYSRHITEKKFYTYMNPYNIGYKVWNWFNINKNEKVYIFEGIFDAISAYFSGIKNVIACLGADIPTERLNELKEPVFCLDNDRTGINNAIKRAKEGHSVVVWPDGLPKDANEMYLTRNNLFDIINSNQFRSVLAEVKLRQKL